MTQNELDENQRIADEAAFAWQLMLAALDNGEALEIRGSYYVSGIYGEVGVYEVDCYE